MNYKKIISNLAKQHNTSKKEIEREMKKALLLSGIKCTPKEFILSTASEAKRRLYIV